MTGTGWYNLVTSGTRSGSFNPDFPGGDPYGSMAMASVVVPNQISDGQSLPRVQVLLRGLKLESFDQTGASLGEAFTNNPAWVLLDVLRRSGWLTSDIDLVSFATAAAYCDEAIETTDLYGNTVLVPRFECNLVLNRRWSAAEVARGIRNGSSLLLTYGNGGLLTLRVENTLALQQPAKPDGSNSTEVLNGGWPAYEFSDGSAEFSGILRKPGGEPAIRLYAQSGADTPNRLTVEFQDEFNEYQQDSLSLVDVDDALLTQREVTADVSGARAAELRPGDADAGSATGEVDGGEHAGRVRDDSSRRGARARRSDHGHVSEGRTAKAAVPGDSPGSGRELSDGPGDGAMARRRLVHVGRRERGRGTQDRRGGNRAAAAAGGKRAGYERDRTVRHHRDGDSAFGWRIRGEAECGVHCTGHCRVVAGEHSAGEFESDHEFHGRNACGRTDAVLRRERDGLERRGKRTVVRGARQDSRGNEHERSDA